MKYPLKRENPDFSGVGSSFISLISTSYFLSSKKRQRHFWNLNNWYQSKTKQLTNDVPQSDDIVVARGRQAQR